MRRSQIVEGFASVLAQHGFAGATMQAVADACSMAPGLLHHYFESKEDMLDELLTVLLSRFRDRATGGTLDTYVVSAIGLGAGADAVAARCWVSLYAEALRTPTLFNRIRRVLDSEVARLQSLSKGTLDAHDASAVLAYILGSLVFGAFAPVKTAGFAASRGQSLVRALQT